MQKAVKECLEDLIAVHDRAPYDLKIDHIDADGLTLTIYTTEPCPAIINYLGDPYGAIIDMDYGIQGEKAVLPMWPELVHILQRTSHQPRSIW